MWTRPIKEKKKETLLPELKKLFSPLETFDNIQTDGELWWTKNFFASIKTHLVTTMLVNVNFRLILTIKNFQIWKRRGAHANLVENAIRNVKRKLYFFMRSQKSSDWTKYLKSKQSNIHIYSQVNMYKLQLYLVSGTFICARETPCDFLYCVQ